LSIAPGGEVPRGGVPAATCRCRV